MPPLQSPTHRRWRGKLLLAALLVALAPGGQSPAITALAARNTAFKLQSEAMRLYKDGSYKQAIDLLRQVTNLSLNSFLAQYYLGLSLSADRQYAAAVEPLRIALELEPSHIQAHIALGLVFLRLGDLDESRAEYLRALKLQETYAPAHDGLGQVYEAQGDDDRAIAAYQKALELNVAYPDAYANLGELYLRRGQLDEAIALFEKAVQVKPDFALGYSRLGIAYHREGLLNQAIAAIHRGKEIAPQDPLPYLALGEILIGTGDFARAESEIEAAISRDPAGHEGYLLRSRLLLAQQDLDGAQRALDAALASEIREAGGRRELEKARSELKDLSSRITERTAAVGANPWMSAPYLDLAALMSRLGAADRAVELARRAAELQPDDATRAALGYYLLLARQYGEALPLLQEAGGHGSPSAMLNLGIAQSALGRHAEAAETFRKYLANHPRDPLPHLYLGNSLLRQGKTGEAEASYRSYLDLASGDERTGMVRRLLGRIAPAGATP